MLISPSVLKTTIPCNIFLASTHQRRSYNELQQGTHKERKIAHPRVFRGSACAHFVPAQGLRDQGNSLFSHPRPLPNRGPLPNHRQVNESSWFCKCTYTLVVFGTRIYCYSVRASARQQPYPH